MCKLWLLCGLQNTIGTGGAVEVIMEDTLTDKFERSTNFLKGKISDQELNDLIHLLNQDVRNRDAWIILKEPKNTEELLNLMSKSY